MRYFETGATRDTDEGKLDYEGFIDPKVLERYAKYMHEHRKQADGKLRDSDNWQKGIPQEAFMKSGWRHFMDWWMWHRGHVVKDTIENVLCAILFNVMGYLSNLLKQIPEEQKVWEDQKEVKIKLDQKEHACPPTQFKMHSADYLDLPPIKGLTHP